MTSFLQDLRFALRTTLKAPAATMVAVLALAFGIGVNVSAFIAVNSIMLHPMPFAHLERIETIWQASAKEPTGRARVSPADFVDLEKQASSFEALAACRSVAGTIQIGNGAEMVQMAQVTAKFFAVLSGKAALGHVSPLEDGAVVVSDAFWKTRLGGAADVVGKRISVANGKATIVGVMPDEFDYPLGTEIWSPLELTPAEVQERSVHNLLLLGLRKPEMSGRQVSAELTAIAGRLAQSYPATNGDESFNVVALRDLTEGVTNRFLIVILAAAGFVLLLACANIGNLQLARATHRQKEIAVRAALGASRFQIARHLFAESLLLSIAAACIGVLLADWNNVYSKRDIPALAMRIVPGLRTMSIDPGVLGFAFLSAVVAGVLCSVPAIVHLSRVAFGNLEESLKERSPVSAHRSSGLFRSGLVVSELALALVLLIGAGLMAGTFQRLEVLNQGFDPKNVLSARVSLPQTAYADGTARLAYYDHALASLLELPGVSSVALASRRTPAYFAIEGRPEHRAGEPLPEIVTSSSRYFEALRIPVVAGRALIEADSPEAPRVVVVSKKLAHFYWPDSSPIGHRIKWEQGGEWFTIVGVSADVIDDWFGGQPSDLAYVSYRQWAAPSGAGFFVRTKGSPLTIASSVRAQLQALDPAVPLLAVIPMEQALTEERSGVRAAARTMSTYAFIALLLAVTGIYAVVSYLVSMRTRDIGVHMALGATGAQILRMMTRQTGKLIVFGIAAGLLLAVILTRLMSHLLFDVVQPDAPLWAGLTTVLLASALLAAYLPAWRATKIDPVAALRHDG